ncbi:cobalt/nickel transport protein [Caldanaerovirga acetigignens]|uniref:Cobalt/nickel transport protein n=1 Tax=Caldanaerovirga acetigignens TaxID=447595 RepID=A0A1M7IY95_9FIRM|nr:energy-coupling factor ABC transporter substrate-binding protein [Caldanaerovirga acetigignens]SHM45267.1 cobalt/nickel transport protein [Caldanaerovirga acetigignens]
MKEGRHLRLLLALMVILLTLLFLSFKLDLGFEGSDDRAMELILNINPDYTPWLSNLWEPESDLMEKLLFGFQVTLGLVLGIYFYLKLKGAEDVSR